MLSTTLTESLSRRNAITLNVQAMIYNRVFLSRQSHDLQQKQAPVKAAEVPVFPPPGCRRFSARELRLLTDNYSTDNFVGLTKYADLYRGKMVGEMGTRAVAVKIFTDSSSGSDSDSDLDSTPRDKVRDEVRFLHDPSIMGRQLNLAKLIGYCPECFGVVYDFNPMDTLDNLIEKDNFTWLQRMKVALQLARLLVFFHDHDPPFILCNIDAGHIMIDQDYHLMLFEFGELVGSFLGNSIKIPDGEVKECLGYVDFGLLFFDPDYDVHDARKICKLAMSCIETLPKDRPTMKIMLEFLNALHVVLLKGIGNTGNSEVFEIQPSELREITCAFSSSNLLGKTQFGKLYRGKFSRGAAQGEEQAVTVKIWDDSFSNSNYSKERSSQLAEEVYLLLHNSLNHHQQSLAKPIGYSRESELLGIVYDVNPRDTLHNLILRDDFTWIQRIKVAQKLSQLLSFFHNYNPPFVVRNLCAAHILVDQDHIPFLLEFEALVGGVWGNIDIRSGKLHGAPGYVDVHYMTVGGCSTTADVFSYGVLLLSLFAKRVFDLSEPEAFLAHFTYLRCKESISSSRLVEDASHVKEIFKDDPDYNAFDVFKVVKLALSCIVHVPEDRPTMKQIYESLQALYSVRRAGIGEPSNSLLRELLPAQLEEFTGKFDKDNSLGSTQFGMLYRGWMKDDADSIQAVTEKVWGDSEDQWSKMMDELHLLQHHSMNDHQQNLAKPIGYSHNCEHPGIVYNLNPRSNLHDEILKENFKWLERMRVALKLARLLAFYHSYDPPCILRNISTQHILVDQDYNPLLFDFGMMVGGLFGNARVIPYEKLYSPPGFLDSSIHIHGKMDMRSDVYAFGVVLLSLLTKKMAFDLSRKPEPVCLDQWAKKLVMKAGGNKKNLDALYRLVRRAF